MTHNINFECTVTETLLRQTVQRANFGHPVDALMLSLKPHGLTEEQSIAIEEILQQNAQNPDPHNAPELYNQLVEVINGNTEGTTQTVVQTDSNVGAITIVTPEPKDTDISITDQTCYFFQLIQDIHKQLFFFLINSKDFVALAKTCSAMNTVFCLSDMYTFFIDKMAMELSIQLHKGWIDIYNNLNDRGKAIVAVMCTRSNDSQLSRLAYSTAQVENHKAKNKKFLKDHYGLTIASPYEENDKCLKLFSCDAAKLKELHSAEFLIYATNKIQTLKIISADCSIQNPAVPIQFWMDALCNSICRNIIFSFASQDLEYITLDNINSLVSSIEKFLLEYDNIELSAENKKLVKIQVIEAIIKQHSNELLQTLMEKFNEFGIEDCFTGFLIRTTEIYHSFIDFQIHHQSVDDLNQQTFDLMVQTIKDKITNVFGLDIEVDRIKEYVKNLIYLKFPREAIQQHAESLLEIYANDIFNAEQFKEQADFLMSLL